MADQRLSRMTLADRLFEQLRQQILSGRLEVGDALPSEQEIGDAFGVGRTTVREGLRGLASSGLVERRGRSLVVRHPDAIDELTLDFASFSSASAVEQAYDVRKLIEVQAVRLAALNRSQDDIAAMERHLARLDTDDAEVYHAADPDFHTAIVKASGNEVLHQVYLSSRQVFFKLPAYWRVFGSSANRPRPPRIGSGYDGHRAIFEAIVARDEDQAASLAGELLDRVKHGLIAAISTRGAVPAVSVDAADATHDHPITTSPQAPTEE